MALSNDNTADADAYELIEQSEEYEYGTAQRCELMDRAVAAADRSGSVRTQFDARAERMTVAVFSGEADVALAMFAWCQRTADDRPDIIGPTAMLWHCKHAMTQLAKFSRITQAQIDAIANDMAKRYTDNGVSLRPVYTTRAIVALEQGKTAEARSLWDEGMRLPRDRYADCAACELDNSIYLLLQEKRFEEVIRAAAPIVAGAVSCAEVPHRTLTYILQARYALGHKEEARKVFEQCYRMIHSNHNFVDAVAVHIEYLAAEHDVQRACQMAVRHLPWLKIASTDMMQERYARAVHRVVLAAAAATGEPASSWRQQLLDGLNPSYGPVAPTLDQTSALQQLARQVADIGMALAASLDRRNGNTHISSQWGAAVPQ